MTPRPRPGDGELTREEYAAWHLAHRGRQPTDVEWARFDVADRNQDGAVGRGPLVAFLFRNYRPCTV